MFKNPERMPRTQRAVVVPSKNDETDRPTRQEKNTLDNKESMTQLLAEASGEKGSDRKG